MDSCTRGAGKAAGCRCEEAQPTTKYPARDPAERDDRRDVHFVLTQNPTQPRSRSC
jgi:hypothetical protein